eukprot:gene18324-24786_t
MDADDLERHKLYIKTADSGGYQRYLLTLLAQRRELQTDSIQKLLLHSQPDDVSIPNEVDPANLLGGALLPGASNLTIDTERQALQQELSVGLECNAELSSAESIRKASEHQALQQELSVGLECNAELSSAESIRKVSGILYYLNISRQALQQELSVGLECNAELSSAESIRKVSATDRAGDMFERMDDAAALRMHFKGRVAAIACEKMQLAEHIKPLCAD